MHASSASPRRTHPTTLAQKSLNEHRSIINFAFFKPLYRHRELFPGVIFDRISTKIEDDIKRWTANRKAALVMEIMQGETPASEAS
jgi:hypothetical protein